MAVTFKDRGCVTHVVTRTMRWQLNAEAACMSHAITGLVNGKNGSDGPCLRAVLHTDAVQTAPVPLGLQLGLDGPQLLLACSHATWTDGRDRSRSDARSWHQRNPGFKLADGALQAGEALSLSAAPPLIEALF